MDRRNFWRDLREYSLTLTGLVGLQFPCLVSGASPCSPLAKFQSLGFPFNMSHGTLVKHFAVSPENLVQGRYHTLVTSIFNHQDEHHWYDNLAVLIPSGYIVHRQFGRKHFLAAFLGGGVVANLTQLCLHTFLSIQKETVLPPPKSWNTLEDFLGSIREVWQNLALNKVSTPVYKDAPYKGANAAISSITAIATCANIVSLYGKYKELRRRRRLGISDQQWDDRMVKELMYEVCHLSLVITVLLRDLAPFFDSTFPSKGIVETVVTFSSADIIHVSQIAGFLFGAMYYLFVIR